MIDISKWIDKNIGELERDNFFCHFIKSAERVSIEDNNYIVDESGSIELVLSAKSIITSIHVSAGNDLSENFKLVSETLPVEFGCSQSEIHRRLGPPKVSEIGQRNLFLGWINPFDKYYFDDYTLRIEYDKDKQRIILITFGSLSLEPGLKIRYQ